MSLFNRNKALVALSLGALAALGACGDDVTVPVAPAAPVVLTISPPSASMNIGESLNFAVQISGGSTTSAPTLASCTSSNTAVATAREGQLVYRRDDMTRVWLDRVDGTAYILETPARTAP